MKYSKIIEVNEIWVFNELELNLRWWDDDCVLCIRLVDKI